MTQEEAISLLNNITSYCDFEDEYGDMIDSEPYYEAVDLAIKALEQTERIAKLVNELDLAEILPKDYDNIFYLQSVKEVKEEMWRMYCFANDVSYTLNL